MDTLYQAPTTDRLDTAQIYIIVSPDNPAKNPHPHYVQPNDADQVVAWVKQGGVLVLMENDPANADINHLNLIGDRLRHATSMRCSSTTLSVINLRPDTFP